MTSPASTRPALRSVEVFAAAAETLSFQQAAAVLHLTPSAVSHRIRELEATLGQPLFLRGHRQLVLTEAGVRYHLAVREALAALHDASDALRLPRGNTLRLSATLSFASTWLMPRLARFRRANPEVELVLETDLKLVDFARGEAHAAVRFGSGRWAGLASQRLLDLHAFPVCAPGRKPQRATAAALRREPLLAVTAGPDLWAEWCALAGLAKPLDRPQRFDHVHVLYEAAANGLGIALGSAPLVSPWLTSGRLVAAFTDPPQLMRHSFYLVHRPQDADWPPLKALREVLLA
ncbi:MAG: LysR substrate-binding domain-containing protein [Pseudomonadota bacterium]